MKNALVVIAIILLALSAGASESGKRHAFVGAGISFLTGITNDDWKMGFHGQVGLTIVAGPRSEFIPKVEFHHFDFDEKGTTVRGGALSLLLIGGDLKYSLFYSPQEAEPFISVGFGIGNSRVSDLILPGHVVIRGKSATDAYVSFGAGLNMNTSSTSVFSITARYVSVLTTGEAITLIPITLSAKF